MNSRKFLNVSALAVSALVVLAVFQGCSVETKSSSGAPSKANSGAGVPSVSNSGVASPSELESGSITPSGSSSGSGAVASSGSSSGGGVPSESEYLAAVQQAADCTKDKGWVVSKVELNSDKVSYGYSISSSDGKAASFSEADQAQAVNDSDVCMEEFVWSSGVETKYLDSKLLSGAEWEADYAEMIRCLKAAGVSGVKVDDRKSEVRKEIPDNNLKARKCLDEHDWQLFGNSGE